jgi:hypothetical protein
MSAPADATLDVVRGSVRKVLTQSAAFRALPEAQRRDLAHDMVKVARYIVDAGGETAGTPMRALVATGLADQPKPYSQRVEDMGKNRETASQRLGHSGATAASSGVNALGTAINKVNFVGFVSGLVEGVFNAIVTSSIRQMEAYGTLVGNIAKSVDEYMRDNISENQARDYLAGKYPQHLKVDAKGGQPKLVPVPGAGRGRGGRGGGARGLEAEAFAAGAPSQLPDFMKDLGLPEPVTRLDPKTAEEKLVPAARRRMAMDRQQLLATMVLMGINRLIVTDGKIQASCVFELDTTDAVYEDTTSAATFDRTTETNQSWGFWFFPGGTQKDTAKFNVSTTNTSSSESTVNLHAQLAGNVDINFRSETFPLEKMADLIQIREIEQKAPSAAAPAPPAAPGMPVAPLPPPPPLPPLPGVPAAGSAPGPAAPAPAGGG